MSSRFLQTICQEKMRKINKANAITLFEIVIVFFLLSILLGALGIVFPKALKGEKFYADVGMIEKKVQLAEELMVDLQIDIALVIEKKEKGITCVFAREGLPEGLYKKLNRNSALESIETFSFQGEEKRHLVLAFESKEGKIPKGELKFFNRDKSALLALPGYPARISRKPSVCHKIQASYPHAVE